MATLPDVLREEGEPENRDIADVKAHGPGHDDVIEYKLDLVGGEVIMRLWQVARSENTMLDPQRVGSL